MPKISFVKPVHKDFTTSKEAILMEALLTQKIPVASSCLGKGVCSKCRISILAGAENLSPETPEEKTLRERNHIPDGMRISCQTKVLGDITIDAYYW